ncbi:DnaJ protein, putative [Plasmodium gallinaceum]|uniref:DnaJ protein, putative n=1 Tax=Plasmodium gallinaceum TaxID=5849 RepID=A0A1J1GP61_PLAGA|nr:DnaJ protein, putative [Plasmodium gallinaceum]CRG94086.1 DnaJ protein, putative [Plasmodium gallinaceum]
MKKKVNSENFYFKKNDFIYNNGLNESSNYFNVNQIKKLCNSENNNIYEQIFDTYYVKRNVLKKRKKEKSYIKNSLSPSLNNTNKINEIAFHINEESITPSLPLHSPLHTSLRGNFKNNNENKNSAESSLKKRIKSNEEYCFYDNYFDQTPKKLIKDDINIQEKRFTKISNENYNRKNKNTLINRNSLNKYDFIRFVCSPNKKRSNEKNIITNNEILSPKENMGKKKENYNKKLSENIFISNYNKNNIDLQKSFNRDINKESNKNDNDKDFSEKSEDKNIGAKVKQDYIEPYDSYSINRLSKNFFINNKKLFINEINKDKINSDDYVDDFFNKNIVNEKNDYTNFDNKENINTKKNLYCENTKINSVNNDFEKFDNNTHYYFNGDYTFNNNIYDKKNTNQNDYLKDINTYVKKNYKMWKSLYSYLDVSYNCSKEEVKKSYKDKIKIYHPDKGGNIKEFLELKLSYDILSNDKKRKLYDKYGNSILELLISEKFNDYNISSDEKNEEEVTDDECLRIYDLFVLKYKNVSYLHNLSNLKINDNQYNEFQKLIHYFFNTENNIFNNIFYIYPVFSPHITPFSKNKKKNNSVDSTLYFDDISSEDSYKTSDNSPSNFKLNEIINNDTKKKKNFSNIYNDIDFEFCHFYKSYMMEKIESLDKNKRKCNKSYENNENENANKTVFKENDDSLFEKDKIKLSNDNSYNDYDNARENKNFYERDSSEFFKDIQLSPFAYRVINDDNKKHVNDFYRWFEFFFEDNLSEMESKEEDTFYEDEEKSLIKRTHKNIYDSSENIKSDNFNKIEQNVQKENEQNLKKNEFIDNIGKKLIPQNEMEKKIKERLKEDNFIKKIEEDHKNNYEDIKKTEEFINIEQENISDVSNIHFEEKEYHKHISNLKDYNENEYKFIDLNTKKKKKKIYAKEINNSFNKHNKTIITHNCNSSIDNTNNLSQFPNPVNSSLNSNCKININSQNEFLEKKFNKSYDDILNIEEKYGFNLIKKSEHKINDVTHDFNYIYIGNNKNKKKNFILFIKEESIKKFLKIKLLISKIKKKTNLKQISLFENEIDKNLKNIEYILLLTTYKEELVPLNDFYLLDKNIYSKDYYCIPLYIKKNNIIRPHFCHFKWIIYTIQSLLFFNLYFKKVNKYMYTFPFFNYKYNCLKKYIENNTEDKNFDKIKDKYIFFQHYIIKNKHKYLKYFPHYLFLYLKDVISLNENIQKQLQINLSPIFVLTPNKLFQNIDL